VVWCDSDVKGCVNLAGNELPQMEGEDGRDSLDLMRRRERKKKRRTRIERRR
jgi:hypothetical protein